MATRKNSSVPKEYFPKGEAAYKASTQKKAKPKSLPRKVYDALTDPAPHRRSPRKK